VVAADLRARSGLLNGILTSMDPKFQLAQPENVLVDFIDSDMQRFVREEVYNTKLPNLRHPDIRLYKPAKTRAIASAKIKTGKLA
jgi:hypothetical protein